MTANTDDKFFLFIGAIWSKEAATDKLKASGISYRWKRLDSRPENWKIITSIVQEPSITGVLCQLNSRVYDMMASPEYREAANSFLRALGSVSHVVFVHEALLTGESRPKVDLSQYELGSYEYFEALERDSYFETPSEEVRGTVSELFEEHEINILPYQTNAELSVLSVAFIDDNEKNLLFRIYVPSGRLYATEADKLLSLFQDWLGRTGRQEVRLDGYRTAAGEIYEFFGNSDLTRSQLSNEFVDFSEFLDLCVDNATEAVATLVHAGVNHYTAIEAVSRYSKEVRRLNLDLRQQRELRMLAIKHGLESELIEADSEAQSDDISKLIKALVPDVGNLSPMHLMTISPSVRSTAAVTVNINQQVINAVESAVVQNIQGTVNLGPQARDLLDLISTFAGKDVSALESAVHELEDPGGRVGDRLAARQRLKSFLIQLGGKVEDAALAVLQNYVQSKMGL